MEQDTLAAIRAALLAELPADGTSIGNIRLRTQLSQRLGKDVAEADYFAARDALLADGSLAKGQGRGGSVRLLLDEVAPLDLTAPEIPAGADTPTPKQGGLTLAQARKAKEAPKPRKQAEDAKVIAYRHEKDRRINIPEVGMVTPETAPDDGKTTWAYDPHIDPALQFDSSRAQIESLIDNALSSGDEATMRAALEQLKRQAAPYLNWTGKAERTSFEVDTVSLHVHERIDPASILAVIQKRMNADVGKAATGDMFRAWFEEPLPLREAVDFYKHDRGWSNRLVAGDSLLVMNSLVQKESMAGQVQMIYIDPPYGIKYGSNFQPFVNKRDVKDRKDEDLTQEPEMIKAFRDTWELGIHSYLTYLRDRLLLAKELLHESGSVFVQISDENLHHVREVMDDIFGAENLVANICVSKTSAVNSPDARTNTLAGVTDYLVWYAKSIRVIKYRALFREKSGSKSYDDVFKNVELSDGRRTRLSSTIVESLESGRVEGRLYTLGDSTSQKPTTVFPFDCFGKTFSPGNRGWRTTSEGMFRAARANRWVPVNDNLRYVSYANDFPVIALNNFWEDTGTGSFLDQKVYVVQTGNKIIERCLLMTTDPGDLALDPTCGSGTTAYVAEKWGRRWITCDTSRVAVTLAKQRLMTASFDYYNLKYPHEGLKAGFIYKTVPHVTLKSIANNPEIDELWARMHPAVGSALGQLNAALVGAGAGLKVAEGGRKGELIAFDSKGVHTLPTGEQVPANALLEWEVPFDFPADWPASARTAFDAFHAARQAMQRKMDESIDAHADQEVLYDQPQKAKDKLRITGPFTVEAVPFPTVLALDEAQPMAEADASIARSGESSRQHRWRDELLKAGIRGKGGQMLEFAELETLPTGDNEFLHLHCSGHLKTGERVVVSFGPEHAALEQRQVELAMREAGDLFPRPKMIVFCAFTFDPEAAKDIDATRGITALKAQMNTDLLTEDLKKNARHNQSFWLMGQPDVEVHQVNRDGKKLPQGQADKDGQHYYAVEVHGFDYFDTASGELKSGGKKNIAAWSLDTDYDERSLFPRQVFFPLAGKKDGWHKLKKDIKAELDASRLDKLHGTTSLPFTAGDHRKVAVKIVDDRGIESLKVVSLAVSEGDRP